MATSQRFELVVASKTYSSWSLRGFLLLDAFGIPFDETCLDMGTPGFGAALAERVPARTVPVLIDRASDPAAVLWDSLAMAEHLAEQLPSAGHWPQEPQARAWARSLAAEMHSSYGALRKAMPMALHHRFEPREIAADVQGDIDRITSLWAMTQTRFGGNGPFLFGEQFTAADAFFAPVVSRFETYSVPLSESALRYCKAVLQHLSVQKWREAGRLDNNLEKKYGFSV
ncbi:MAG: glutathione S-transferase [Neomegalonema sp.]|nr:glutathione S-transferase [Neomegalonema sp.]